MVENLELQCIKQASVSNTGPVLFSIIKNEDYFLPFFFNHYRRIGISNFLIYDDHSDEPTLDFLHAQADCTIVGSQARFGDDFGVDNFGVQRRLASFLKEILPDTLLSGRWVLTADADEFLTALERERERLRREDGAHTAALEPIAPIAVLPAQPPYQHPASYTTQPIAPIGPATGAYGASSYWDPNTTGIIPPGAVLLPPGGERRSNPWPWVILGVIAVAAAAAAIIYALDRNHTTQVPVPRVVGLMKPAAQAELSAAGLNSVVVLVHSKRQQKGDVVSEIPAAGAKLAKGSTVTLNVSQGPAPPGNVQVPSVVNLDAAEATHVLHQAGFNVTPVKQSSTTVPKNTVISTNPQGGSPDPHGATIFLTYSTGPPRVAVPNAVNQPLAAAELLIQQRGFVPAIKHQVTSAQPPGTVLSQTPASGKAAQGSTITLTVAKAPSKVTIPHLAGKTGVAAAARLGALGLNPQVVQVDRSVNQPYDGLVLSTVPKAGSSVAPRSTVELRIEHYVAPVGPTGPTGPTGAT